MDDLALSEKRKHERVWDDKSNREISPGLLAAPGFLSFFTITPGETLIDFGCGMGLTTLPFFEKGLRVSLVDIAENCLDESVRTLSQIRPLELPFHAAPLWDLPATLMPADWIFCINALEHLPEEKVDASLKAMASRTKKGGALQVSLLDRAKPFVWWEEKISALWKIEKVVPTGEDQYCFFVRSFE